LEPRRWAASAGMAANGMAVAATTAANISLRIINSFFWR
jgi:hypothetical protein